MAQEITAAEYSEEVGGPVWASLFPNRVVVSFHYTDDARWDAIVAWVEDAAVAGRFAFSSLIQAGENERVEFWFTDPNAAFSFRMRWC